MLVLTEYLQPQLLLGYPGMTKAYGGFFRTINKEVLCEGKPQSPLRAGAGLAGNHWEKNMKPKTLLLLPQLWKCQVDFGAVELI